MEGQLFCGSLTQQPQSKIRKECFDVFRADRRRKGRLIKGQDRRDRVCSDRVRGCYIRSFLRFQHDLLHQLFRRFYAVHDLDTEAADGSISGCRFQLP